MAGRIGVNKTAADINQEGAGAKAVERILQRQRLGLVEIHGPADHHCAADMRHDHPHALARCVIGNAVPFVTEDAEHRDICPGLVDDGPDKVDEPLRPHPLLVELRPLEFLVRQEIGDRERPLEFAEVVPDRQWVERRVAVRIKLQIMRICAMLVE